MEMVYFIPPTQRRIAMLAAQADSAPVLISGSSGTGKGAIVKWIHSQSARAALPLRTYSRNRSLTEQLMEAQGGSLEIGELGELPLGEQRLLLQFLKTRSVPHPSAAGLPMIVQVRIIATTSQDLEKRAQAGLFNAELLKKMSIFKIDMPSLASRGEEFHDIVLALIQEITRELHKEHLREVSAEAWDCLRGYDWPGNLRELRNVLRMAVIAAQGDRVELTDLPDFAHDAIDFRATRDAFERIYLGELLKTFGGDVAKAAQASRISKEVLEAKLKRLQLIP